MLRRAVRRSTLCLGLRLRFAKNKRSFASQYRAYRLVYYEEFGDIEACIRREKQIKGWTRAKKNALVTSFNPKWRDLMAEWEEKYGFDFVVQIPVYEGKATAKTTPMAKANARSFAPKARAQDDNVF